MCKKIFKSLFGSAETPQKSAVQQTAAPMEAGGEVKNSKLVESTGGREASGRIGLGKNRKGQANVAGLSL